MAAIIAFNMYAIDTPCFEILSYVIKNTNGINIGLTSEAFKIIFGGELF